MVDGTLGMTTPEPHSKTIKRNFNKNLNKHYLEEQFWCRKHFSFCDCYIFFIMVELFPFSCEFVPV